MSKINVKIPTASIVKALEERLAKVKSDYANQEKLEADYNKQVEKWEKGLASLMPKSAPKSVNVSDGWRVPDDKVELRLEWLVDKSKVPAKPEKDYVEIHSSTYREQVEEMENALRILGMTTDTEVSTSTYNAICRYL
jgi:hypothetical protein